MVKLFERVKVVSGQYAGKHGVIERIIPDGENKGLWIEIEGVFGLHCIQDDCVEKQEGQAQEEGG